jgi:cytochrome c-type biogenesis protein CcmH/NrfG
MNCTSFSSSHFRRVLGLFALTTGSMVSCVAHARTNAAAPSRPTGAGAPAASAPSDAHEASADARAARAETIDASIARGKAALELGRAAEAQKIFEDAAARDASSLCTRVWVLRSWLAQGRVNDTLNATDELSRAGAKGPEIDYLYGIAFALIARTHLEQQNGGGLIELNLKDAVAYLDKATKADPERFSDAFALLAEAAWQTQELDIARAAAEKAAAAKPSSAEAAIMLGRVALAQFSALASVAERKAEADKDWDVARAALTRAIELASGADVASAPVASANGSVVNASAGATSARTPPKDPALRTLAAKAHVDLGHAFKWKDENDDASREYAAAMACDPTVVNYQQLLGALGKESFASALEAGAKAFRESSDAGATNDAGLVWWLGWSRFDRKDFAKADEAFSEAVRKEPAFVNSWYYIALSRYHQQDYDGAIAALRRHLDESAPDLLASIKSSAEANLRMLDFLVGFCAKKQRSLDAAILSEIQAEAAPENADYWNNAGLFYRDAGAELRAQGNPDERERAMSYFEKAYAAYGHALEISPDNPALLNDTAVMLHYYLDRDAEKAKAMYEKAAQRAGVELERTDLSADQRELYQTALRDSKNNLAKLERGDKREG